MAETPTTFRDDILAQNSFGLLDYKALECQEA